MTSRQLKIARAKLGWSQKRLAKELGVTIFTLSKYENHDINPAESRYMKKIPRVVDLALRYLLIRESERDKLTREASAWREQNE